MGILHVIWSIIIGFIVGLIARAIVPGAQHLGLIVTTPVWLEMTVLFWKGVLAPRLIVIHVSLVINVLSLSTGDRPVFQFAAVAKVPESAIHVSFVACAVVVPKATPRANHTNTCWNE